MASYLALATALLAATTTTATLLRSPEVLIKPYLSPQNLNPPTLLLARQLPSASSIPKTEPSVRLNPNGSLNFTAWDAATSAACANQLKALRVSTNPSGTCICYNLPSLDAATGAFEADLRLYRISEPRGDFEGVDPADVRVGLVYKGASVSTVSTEALMGMGDVAAGNSSSLSRRAGTGPPLLKTYMFVGQIDKQHLSQNMSMAALEALLMPTLSLTAAQPGKPAARTTVSLNEAAFLTGVFSQQVVQSDFAAAQAAVDKQLAALKNGTLPFVMPGTQFMIFPVGLLVTSVWALVGMAVYALGTYERVAFRGNYMERVAFRDKN